MGIFVFHLMGKFSFQQVGKFSFHLQELSYARRRSPSNTNAIDHGRVHEQFPAITIDARTTNPNSSLLY
jgi:hypothetical protein